MANIPVEIADLEFILTNHKDKHTEEEIQGMEEDLARLNYIHDLWMTFGNIPMDPETECLEEEWAPKFQFGGRTRATFPAGTHREDIWHWFEEEFNISIAEDLMY